MSDASEKKTEEKGLNALETENIGSLLRKFCVPSLASSLVTSFYNIVDQMFIGGSMGVNGNAAANVVFPAVTLITALSLMCGVGTSALFNLSAGKKDMETAKKTIVSGYWLMVFCGAAVALILLIATEPVLRLFGCTDPVMPLAKPYARIIALGFVFSMIGASGPFVIRADGSPNFALVCIATGSLLNIGLDALFILGFGWGIRGAGWATFIAQGVSAAMVLIYMKGFKTLEIRARDLKPDFRICGRIAKLGAGPAFNFLTQALVQVFLNNSLRIYGAASVYGAEAALGAAGVANKVNTIAAAVVQGLTNGMQPIVSYNYGRGNYRRTAETGKKVVSLVLIAGLVIFACYQLIPVQITMLFGRGSDLYYEFAAKFFRIFFLLITLNGLQSSIGGFFSAQGRPGMSILISLTRQVIFLPPLLVVLPKFFGLDGVLWSGPIADLAMAILAATLLIREFRRLDRLAAESEGGSTEKTSPDVN